MNRRRLLASAPAPIVGPDTAAPAAPAADPPPCYQREGVAQLDAVGPDMERRNVPHLRDSIGFCERDAALRAIHPGPSDWAAVAARHSAHYEAHTAIGRRRAAARKARA